MERKRAERPRTNASQKLLNRICTWYEQAFQDDPLGRQAVATLGLTDVGALSDFRVGYANGSLLTAVPEGSELWEKLRTAGVLDQEGREVLAGCVAFPWFDENGDCVGLWGLRVSDGAEVFLDVERRGVWNWQSLKRNRSVILAPSILDGVLLHQAGFRDVTALWGKDGLTEDHLRLMQMYGTKETLLTFEVEAQVWERLRGEGITVLSAPLPKLPADPQVIADVFRQALPSSAPESEVLKKLEALGYEATDLGFAIQYGERHYEIKGVEREGVKLKVTVKVHKAGEEKKFYLDSMDLYSQRSRMIFAKGVTGFLGEKGEVVEQDLGKLVELAERFEPRGTAKPISHRMTKAEEAEALSFLKDPRLWERLLEDFEACGYTGEEANKRMGYLCAVSRKLDDPLSVLIQSRSAAGKSTLQDAVLRFVPPEDVEKYTRLTGQALFYKDADGLKHKLLAIEEEAGAKDASYSIRNLQSSKMLSIATTGKDPLTGKLKTNEYRVEGPVALMLTTTAVDMDFETANRFITLTIDESKEMTERILARQREMDTLEGLQGQQAQERVAKRHQNAQRLLKPLWVVNPYAPKLAFPASTLRARRDQKKYLGLIKTIAFLHQHQREVKELRIPGDGPEGARVVAYVEVEPQDIEKANALAGAVLWRTLDELSAPGRALLAVIRGMVKAKDGEGEHRFTRRDIREACGWGDFQLKTHLGELVELEYLWAVAGRKGKEYVYELAEAQKEPRLDGLTAASTLAGVKN